MENNWMKTIAKEDFISEITQNQEFTDGELEAMENNISNEVNYYISFENSELKTYVKYSSENSAFMTSLALESSQHDPNQNITEHLLIGYDPVSNEELGRITFVEDFGNDTLFTESTAIQNYRYAEISTDLDVDTGNGWRLKLCCAACLIVHDALNIHWLDCICCGFRCGFTCGPQT